MLQEVIASLTQKQRAQLETDFGIKRNLLSMWRTGDRLPTEVQAVALAEVSGADRHELQDEIALLRATPEQRSALKRLMNKAQGIAAGVLLAVVVAVTAGSLGFGAPSRLFSKR